MKKTDTILKKIKTPEIYKNINLNQWIDYKWQIKNSITSIDELQKKIKIPGTKQKGIKQVIQKYPFKITPYYLSLIIKSRPLYKQVIPDEDEIKENNLPEDPFNENNRKIKGIIQRYQDRLVILLNNNCFTFCRHCNRKRSTGIGNEFLKKNHLEKIVEYIKENKKIKDVLISGGDPFYSSINLLNYLLVNLRKIKHLKIIRIGTRSLVTLPMIFYNEKRLNLLKKYAPIYINTHFNHFNEITNEARYAVKNILLTGSIISNQTVLLKGINDNFKILKKLFYELTSIGIRPYYLFQADPVKGTGHFRTTIEKGINIIKCLRENSSGMIVPNYAVDLPKGKGKVILLHNGLLSKQKNNYILKNYKNEAVEYF